MTISDPYRQLAALLALRNVSQRTLAKQLGISFQYLHDIFLNRRRAQTVRDRLVEEFKIPRELVEYRPPPVRSTAVAA